MLPPDGRAEFEGIGIFMFWEKMGLVQQMLSTSMNHQWRATPNHPALLIRISAHWSRLAEL
jgi:hypothetical protein